jgi:hypothetical protein
MNQLRFPAFGKDIDDINDKDKPIGRVEINAAWDELIDQKLNSFDIKKTPEGYPSAVYEYKLYIKARAMCQVTKGSIIKRKALLRLFRNSMREQSGIGARKKSVANNTFGQ